jgi:hypothetical protein
MAGLNVDECTNGCQIDFHPFFESDDSEVLDLLGPRRVVSNLYSLSTRQEWIRAKLRFGGGQNASVC